jgi:hypothetical protein
VPELPHVFDQLLLELEAGMVRSQIDAHRREVSCSARRKTMPA